MPPNPSADEHADQWARFCCRWRPEGRAAASVRVTGELDIATAPQFDGTVRGALGHARLVLVDVHEMSFVDSSGLRVILDTSIRAGTQDARVVLAGASAHVEKVLDRTGTRARLNLLDAPRPEHASSRVEQLDRVMAASVPIGVEIDLDTAGTVNGWHEPRSGIAIDQELDAITDAMVTRHLRCHGRMPATAETHLLGGDVLACKLGGIYTDVEKTMAELQRTRDVHGTRSECRAVTRHKFIEVVERVSGRTVAAFISNYHVGPDLAVELFLLEPAV